MSEKPPAKDGAPLDVPLAEPVVLIAALRAEDADAAPHQGRGLKRFRARWFAMIGALAIALYLCWLLLEPFLDVLLWATVLAIIFYPVHQQIVNRSGVRASWAAVLSTLLVVTVILAPFVLVTLAVVQEATTAAGKLQDDANRLLDPNAPVYRWIKQYGVQLDLVFNRQLLATVLRSGGGTIAGRTFSIAGDVVVVMFKIALIILSLYYLFRDGERIQHAMLEGLPLERAQTQRIFDRTREVITASVYGVFAIATVQAVLGGVAFWILGLPSALLWSVIMFFFSMIPAAGSFLVWVPAALYLGLTGHWWKAAILTAWCAGIVASVDNVLRPRLVGKRTRMHELLVLFSILGGLKVFGALGLVVGPVVVAITLALIDIFSKAERRDPAAREPTLAEAQAALRNVPNEEEEGEEEKGDKETGRQGDKETGAALKEKEPVLQETR
jgi:predicted PurR-regulated permease PerM